MNRLFLVFFILLVLPLLQSCATANKSIMRKDPFIDKIIDTKTSSDIDFETLIKNISNYDVIYLSEKHDNPDHHFIQQNIIQKLIEKELEPSIGFEFFSMDDTPDLLNFIDSGKVAHSKKIQAFIEKDLRKKLGWDTQSDKLWQYYFDLLGIAKTANLSVAGIDLPTTLKKRITRKGIDNISPIEKEKIFSTRLSSTAYREYMFEIFKAVHCGMGNDKMQSRIYDTWVARNDKMALSISQIHQHSKGPVIIIIGGGHTEYGLGVMDKVSVIDPDIRQINIAIREINRNPSLLTEYLAPLNLKGYDPVPPADYLWFTQRVSYADPCEEFKKSLNKMRKHSTD